jgi:hypothetical protein
MAMNCAEFEAHCADWMEGERTAEARAHLLACARCRALVADLEAIRMAAPALAEDVDPPASLWPKIEAALRSEGIIRPQPRLWWLGPVPVRLALGTALATLVTIVAVGVYRRPAPAAPRLSWLQHDQAELARVDRQVRHAASETAVALNAADPAVRDTLVRNLAALDRQIEVCSRTLEDDPDDEITRSYLFEAYHQKSDLLTLMAERVTTGE